MKTIPFNGKEIIHVAEYRQINESSQEGNAMGALPAGDLGGPGGL